jgi:hypothetical protein
MTSSNQMLNHISSFPGVDTIATQVPEVQLLNTESEVQPNSAPSSDCVKAPLLNVVKLPYQATHQVELLHLHAEIEALLQQVRTLKQQRLADSNSLNHDELDLSHRDRPVLAIR